MFMVIDVESGQPIIGSGQIVTFETGASAAIYARQYCEATGKKAQVRVLVNDDWQKREQARFDAEEYLPVAWHKAAFWVENAEIHKLHYAHRSKVKDTCIAYTESAEKGAQDRQTRIKAGAYLTKYFSHILTDSEINFYARLHAAVSGDLKSEIKIAVTADEIERVYVDGPDSCMAYPAHDYQSPVHPVRVYGDSDLQLAYVERPSDYHEKPIAARALIWPERKIYGRIYPTPERYHDNMRTIARAEYAAMAEALESMGYKAGRFDGARIRVIRSSRYDSFVMPYLDGTSSLELDCGHFVIDRNGSYSACNTNGLLHERSTISCERCDDDVDEGDTYSIMINSSGVTEQWCESCYHSESFHCHGSDETYSDRVSAIEASDGYIYALHYAQDNLVWCDATEIYLGPDESSYCVNTSSGYENWCEDHVNYHAFVCHHDSEYYASDDYDCVEINGKTYEKQNAIKAGLLVEETETEEA